MLYPVNPMASSLPSTPRPGKLLIDGPGMTSDASHRASICIFNPARNEFSPLSVDIALIRLLRDLCPEAHKQLHGDVGETPVGRFCRETPAPANVGL